MYCTFSLGEAYSSPTNLIEHFKYVEILRGHFLAYYRFSRRKLPRAWWINASITDLDDSTPLTPGARLAYPIACRRHILAEELGIT